MSKNGSAGLFQNAGTPAHRHRTHPPQIVVIQASAVNPLGGEPCAAASNLRHPGSRSASARQNSCRGRSSLLSRRGQFCTRKNRRSVCARRQVPTWRGSSRKTESGGTGQHRASLACCFGARSCKNNAPLLRQGASAVPITFVNVGQPGLPSPLDYLIEISEKSCSN